jgi:hypothetical protein
MIVVAYVHVYMHIITPYYHTSDVWDSRSFASEVRHMFAISHSAYDKYTFFSKEGKIT